MQRPSRATLRAFALLTAFTGLRTALAAEDWSKIRAQAENAVVFIESVRENLDGTGAPEVSKGTGFIVSEDGYVITTAHVILEPKPDTRVITKACVRSRKTPSYQLDLIKKDVDVDVAVLLLPDIGPQKYVEFGDSRSVPKDTPLYTLGFPGDSELSSAEGLLSNKRAARGNWQTTIPINRGNSGGPVFDKHGKVVAIANAGNDAEQLVTFAVPEAHARPLLQIAIAEARSLGRRLAYMVATYLGGKANIDQIHTIRQMASFSFGTSQGFANAYATSVKRYPDSQRLDMFFFGGSSDASVTHVVSPSCSFTTGTMGTGLLPMDQHYESLADLRADFFYVVKNIDNPKYTFSAHGIARIGNVDANIVQIDAEGTVLQWYIDPTDGKLLRTAARRASTAADNFTVTEYGDWQTTMGIKYPTSSILRRNGRKAGEIHVDKFEINPLVSGDIFDIPDEIQAIPPDGNVPLRKDY